MATLEGQHPISPTATNPLSRLISTIVAAIADWQAARAACLELSQLSDYELEDIGIRRSDIPYIVLRSI